MRTNLHVPFSQKDQAKALGARWDSAQKTWYVENPKNLEPFSRWLSPQTTPTKTASKASVTPEQTQSSPTASHNASPKNTFPSCSCPTPPWEECTHTIAFLQWQKQQTN